MAMTITSGANDQTASSIAGRGPASPGAPGVGIPAGPQRPDSQYRSHEVGPGAPTSTSDSFSSAGSRTSRESSVPVHVAPCGSAMRHRALSPKSPRAITRRWIWLVPS